MTANMKSWLESLTANQLAFWELWKKTLMQNRSEAKAEEDARDLTKNRIECQKRGMPDFHPDIESAVWKVAFLDHAAKCRTSGIRPTWTNPKDGLGGICNCFEIALDKMKMDGTWAELNKAKPEAMIVLVDPEESFWENRFE